MLSNSFLPTLEQRVQSVPSLYSSTVIGAQFWFVNYGADVVKLWIFGSNSNSY